MIKEKGSRCSNQNIKVSPLLLHIILHQYSVTLQKQTNVWVNRLKNLSHNFCKSVVPKKFCTYSPSPPAPRKMPPTASASHSRDTPMMMQPATMLSRAEPTRSPWYSPMLTGFIQQVEAPPPGLHTYSALTLYSASTWALTATGNSTLL